MEKKMFNRRNVRFIRKNYRADFDIEMKNYSFMLDTGEEKVSILRSKFYREIYKLAWHNVGFTRYNFTETEYKASAESDFKPWTFAKDAEFYNCLFCLRSQFLKDAYYREAGKESPIPPLSESFSKYPKLPSVYLLVMQAIDVITFDAFMCMVNSQLFTKKFDVNYSSVDEMYKRNIEIGSGVYSKQSYYLNNKLYVRLSGETVYNGKKCWVFNYSSDPSNIYMEHIKLDIALKSKSLYSGCFYLLKSTGDIVYGELDEDVVSRGKNKKYSKRTVILKRGLK